MACSGGYCASQCYSNICSYTAPNENWNYNGSGFNVTAGCASNVTFPTAAGQPIYNENLDRLAGAINDERARRGYGAFSFDAIQGSVENPGSPPSGTIIYGTNASVQERMIEIKTAINNMSSGLITYTVTDGNPLTYAQVNQAKVRLNNLRNACLCNSNCGANLVCSCYNDCGCNYSDERLKKDIRSL